VPIHNSEFIGVRSYPFFFFLVRFSGSGFLVKCWVRVRLNLIQRFGFGTRLGLVASRAKVGPFAFAVAERRNIEKLSCWHVS
jgi:hypothetical protein